MVVLAGCYSKLNGPGVLLDGGDGDGDTTLRDGAAGGGSALAFSCPAGTATIVPGLNTLELAGGMRSFYADFPPATTIRLGVLFSWHGYNQVTATFRTEVALDPQAAPELPMIVITPVDTGLQPPQGLDWDIINGTPQTNRDLALFEAIVGCLNDQVALDPGAVFSFGFSAGAVMTNLVHARYPALVHAIVTESGAWFDDPAEVALVNYVHIAWKWPALVHTDGGEVLMTHGGPNDITVLNLLDIEKAAQAAKPFLRTNMRDVLDCTHTGGHALDPDITPVLIGSYLASHRVGGAPADFVAPTSCSPVP
ncbi:MAG: PHB depolymerase family esterase [Kofleriaceae bacterium]